MNFDLRKHTHLLTVAGSRAYGMHTPESDLDVKGVAIPPLSYFLGFLHNFTQADKPSHLVCYRDLLTPELAQVADKSKLEGSIYGLTKFAKLAAECNPNILDVLFCRDEEVIFQTEIGRQLRESRDLFISAKAKHTFSGYAHSQLKRIRLHREWLLNPPQGQPTRSEFGLPDHSTLLPKKQLQEIEAAVKKKLDSWSPNLSGVEPADRQAIEDSLRQALQEFQEGLSLPLDLQEDAEWLAAARHSGIPDQIISTLRRERKYNEARRRWKSFQTWKKNRKPERAELEAQYGFDCYSHDTEFLTEAGWKGFDEVQESDRLATVYIGPDYKHRGWGEIEYQRFTERFDSTFSGNLYHFEGHHTDCLVTPNHRMLTRSVGKNTGEVGKWELEEAARLHNCFDILHTIKPLKKTYGSLRIFEDLPIPPEAYLRLMGWFLSDGTMSFRSPEEREDPNCPPKQICISQKKGGRLCWHLSSFCGKYGESAQTSRYEYLRKPNGFNSNEIIEVKMVVTSSILRSRMYSDCGHSKDKRIPRWVFGLSKRLKEILFDAMMAGDGTVRATSKESGIYYTSLEGLANDVHELALLCGWETSLWGPYSYPDAPTKELWQVHVYKDAPLTKRLTRSVNISKVPVEGHRIVCFSVPNGTLVTRRNGRTSIHGNCKHGAHLVRLMRMGKEILETGQVNVWRGDRDAEELLSIRNGAWSYERLVGWAEQEDKTLTDLYKKRQYSIPHTVRMVKIDEFIRSLLINVLLSK